MATMNPYRNFRFRIEIDSLEAASFSEATMTDSSTDSFDYREGMDPPYPRKLSGLVKFNTVSLKRGVTDSMEIYSWRKLVQQRGSDAPDAKRNISVVLIDEQGEDRARWNLYNCWPSKYESSGFNAGSAEAMIETLEVQVENMERMS